MVFCVGRQGDLNFTLKMETFSQDVSTNMYQCVPPAAEAPAVIEGR